MIDVAMLVYDRPRITRTALDELARRTTTPYRLFVCDNGSGKETRDVIDERVPGSDIVRLDKNYGTHWGHNRLLDLVESEYFVSTDNDIVPQSPVNGRDWLSHLVELLDARPTFAAIACRPHAMIGDNVNVMFSNAPEVVERWHVGAVLRLMRTEAVQHVGGWRWVDRPLRDDEERYICGKLRDAGWKVGYARDVRAIHLWGRPDLGEDEWGYSGDLQPQDHGHNPIHPPPSHSNWDRLGIDWESCK